MLTALPIVAAPSCDRCGACCTYVGVPPGYGRFFYPNSAELPETVWDSEDGIRWQNLPDDVRAELTHYDDEVQAGLVADRTQEFTACLWYDENAQRCRHYDWRPQVCRDYRAGSDSCLAIRQGMRIDKPV